MRQPTLKSLDMFPHIAHKMPWTSACSEARVDASRRVEARLAVEVDMDRAVSRVGAACWRLLLPCFDRRISTMNAVAVTNSRRHDLRSVA